MVVDTLAHLRAADLKHLVKTGFTRDIPVTLEQLIWGVCTFMSRSWVDHAMFPFAELANHAGDDDEVNAYVGTGVFPNTTQIAAMQLLAKRDIGVGEEVVISYGQKHNADLLVNFGFVLPRNKHDVLRLPRIDDGERLVAVPLVNS